MAKVNQTAVREKLEEWAKYQNKIVRAEKARNNELAPIVEAHNEEVKPILAVFDEKVQPWRELSAKLETEIKAMVESDRDEKGNPKPVLIASEKATAIIEKKEGARIVDAHKFFDAVKVKTQQFWNSLKVTIKDAEPIIGKNEIDNISEKRTTYVSTVKLN